MLVCCILYVQMLEHCNNYILAIVSKVAMIYNSLEIYLMGLSYLDTGYLLTTGSPHAPCMYFHSYYDYV